MTCLDVGVSALDFSTKMQRISDWLEGLCLSSILGFVNCVRGAATFERCNRMMYDVLERHSWDGQETKLYRPALCAP